MTDTPINLASALSRMADEALDMADISGRLEADLSPLMARLIAAEPGLVATLQSTDLLTQRLAGLALFLDSLARAACPAQVIDAGEALSSLTLESQVVRFGGEEAATAFASDQPLFFAD